ncbi:MAG: hypothetical protein SWX82_30840 [Cyanobacteriota bacterium]|nr:hypothetical protein [Cyanobacteriota bacterium]
MLTCRLADLLTSNFVNGGVAGISCLFLTGIVLAGIFSSSPRQKPVIIQSEKLKSEPQKPIISPP